MRAKLMSKPHPYVFGVNRRRSAGFHHRDLKRVTVGRRQSYGTPKNFRFCSYVEAYVEAYVEGMSAHWPASGLLRSLAR